jgi:hypothetical protein
MYIEIKKGKKFTEYNALQKTILAIISNIFYVSFCAYRKKIKEMAKNFINS